MIKNIFGLFFACVVLSCKPLVQTALIEVDQQLPVFEGELVVFELSDTTTFTETPLANIQVGENGFTNPCDYNSMMNQVKLEAKRLGGNAVKIIDHKKPDAWSSCHRFKAAVYRLTDIWHFEKEIVWSEDKPLQIRDFKASTKNRPERAKTNTSIIFFFERANSHSEVLFRLKTIFDTNRSYFKTGHQDQINLELQQNHFDIAELHARMLTKNVADLKLRNLAEFDKKFPQEVDKILLAQDQMKDEHDADVKNNIDRWKDWKKTIISELEKYEGYAKKEVVVPVK